MTLLGAFFTVQQDTATDRIRLPLSADLMNDILQIGQGESVTDLAALYVEKSSTSPGARGGRKLILSVDDEDSVLYARYLLLTAAGYAVISTTDGANALQLFANYPVDLVLLDYILPEIDGSYLAQAMREYAPRVPIIMVSAMEVPEQRLESVNRYLNKGEGPEALIKAVTELVSTYGLARLRPGA